MGGNGVGWGAQISLRLAASYSQCCIVRLRFRICLCLCSGMFLFRSSFHALRISCTVQCCLGRPTRFLVPMFGLALVFWNVASLVGASPGSLSMCFRSLS